MLVARNVVALRDFDEQRHLDLLVATLDAAVRDRSREHAATRTRRRNENRDAVDSIDRPRRISDAITWSIGISNTSGTPGPITVPRNYRRTKHSLWLTTRAFPCFSSASLRDVAKEKTKQTAFGKRDAVVSIEGRNYLHD